MVSTANPMKFGRMKLHPATVLRQTSRLRRRRVTGSFDTGDGVSTNVAMSLPRLGATMCPAGSPPGTSCRPAPSRPSLVENRGLGLVLGVGDGDIDRLAAGQRRRVQRVEDVLQTRGVLGDRVLRLDGVRAP